MKSLHLWNARALAEALRDGTLSEETKFKYLVAATFLSAAFARPGLLGMAMSVPEFYYAFAYVTITLVGLIACYQANQAGDSDGFIERFICLGVPVMIRWMVVFYGIYYAVALLNRSAGGELLAASRVDPQILYMGYALAMQLAYFVWLRGFVQRAAEADEAAHLQGVQG